MEKRTVARLLDDAASKSRSHESRPRRSPCTPHPEERFNGIVTG